MQTLGMTHSTCPACRQIVPAKVITDGTTVFFQKFCPDHGQIENLVYSDLNCYLKTQRYVKSAWIPKEFSGDNGKACPDGCGFCNRHEQHLCMPIIEITSKCNLNCPICIADAGRDWEMTIHEFRKIIDGLIRAEGQVDILTLSGGEPLLHSKALEIIDEALSHPEIIRVAISTNGLPLLDSSVLAQELYKRNVVVSLQFDGFDDRIYQKLRGKKLLDQKLKILHLLTETNISTSLTVTAAAGVNTDQWPRILDYFFGAPNVVSITIHSLTFAGRAFDLLQSIDRLATPDMLKIFDNIDNSKVRSNDFVPLPCSHPLCFCLAYYLVCDDGGVVSINQLVEASTLADSLSNRTIFGLDVQEHERLKDMIYDLWSGPAGAAPHAESVMRTLRGILDEINKSGFKPRSAFTVAERHIKSIFIHAFQDAETFDMSRVRRCCQAYPQPDGTLVPACVHNVLGRKFKRTDII